MYKEVDYYQCRECGYKISVLEFFSVNYDYECRSCYRSSISQYETIYREK